MNPFELLQWATPIVALAVVHIYMSGVRARSTIHARLDKLNDRLERRGDDWRAELAKINAKLDAHHTEFLERVVHLEASMKRMNGH